jgi:cytochrome c6
MNAVRMMPFLFFAGFALTLSSSAASAASAKQNWTDHCAKCHGEDGKGNTRSGRKLRIKDLTTARIQARLTADRALESIAEGIFDNDGNERMPAFRDKLTEEERAQLLEYVKTLAAEGT